VALVAIYDSCVLYPAALRDLLVRVAAAGVVRARWSERILDECFRNILQQRPDLKPEALARTRQLMTEAVPDCLVTGFEGLIEGLVLPDSNDRHVLAAAVRAGASMIVTSNLKHFPAESLAPHGIEAVHPDEFLLLAIDRAAKTVGTVLMEQAAALRNPPRTVVQVLDTLHAQGVARAAAKLRELLNL